MDNLILFVSFNSGLLSVVLFEVAWWKLLVRLVIDPGIFPVRKFCFHYAGTHPRSWILKYSNEISYNRRGSLISYVNFVFICNNK